MEIMKKCPFCAEEIQDEAIKCKHCGEWLNDEPSIKKDKAEKRFEAEDEIYHEQCSCVDEECVGTIDDEGICNECGRTKQEIENGVHNKAKTPEIIIPIKEPKLGWGWGWIILILFFQQSDKVFNLSHLRSVAPPLLSLTPIIVYISTMFLYFKLRRLVFEKSAFQMKKWGVSLIAGVLSLFFMAIMLNIITSIGGY